MILDRRLIQFCGAALIGLSSSSVAWDSSVAESPGPERGPVADVAFKPLADTAIEIDDTSLSPSDSQLRVGVAARTGVTIDHVTVVASGGVDVDDAPVDVVLDAWGTGVVTVDVDSVTGTGQLTATLTATDGDGTRLTMSDTVWVTEVRGVPVVSSTGSQDLAIAAADLAVDLGALSPQQAKTVREQAVGGNDVAVVAEALGSCVGICIKGTASWTDAAGQIHPVRRAPVEIRESNVGGDALITTVTTTDAGAFSANVNAIDPEGGNRDIYVRVRAEGPGFKLVRGTAGNPTQFIESSVTPNVAAGTTLTLPFVANNVADNNTVFSLQNAMVVAGEYLPSVHSQPIGDIEVVFPSTGSFYSGTRVHLLQLDRWDWDVLLHEYGHFVADQLNIENNPGGSHSSSRNLADYPGRNKDLGIRLAWGEGWATYFAVSLLADMNTASLGIANVGDTKYQDTEDANIVNDLEVGATLGEDNEATVMGVLWDLYDTESDGLDEIDLGAQVVWSALDAADPETLSDAAAAFSEPTGNDGTDCVFSEMNVAPRLTGPASTAVDEAGGALQLAWSRGNGGINGSNDLFIVEVRDRTGAKLLHASGSISSTTYRVPAAAWAAAVADGGGEVVVTVIGAEVNAPITGPYRSCPRRFVSDQEPTPPQTDPLITSIVPARFADTRPTGATVDARFEGAGRRTGDSTYRVVFAGRPGVPADARAVVANLTAVQPVGIGFVTAFECGAEQPVVSSLNYAAGVNVGNEVIINLADDGSACLYTSENAHLTIDVTGFVAADSNYQAVTPARLLDTRRDGQRTVDRKSEGAGRTIAGFDTVLPVVDRAGIPSDAVAVVVNVTAVANLDTGYVTVHPCLDEVPLASSLNYVAGVNRGNELITALGDDGTICLVTSSATHLTADVVGYVPADTGFTPVTPARLVDTRPEGRTIDGDHQQEGRRVPGTEYVLPVTGRHGIPTDAGSVVVNVTAVNPLGVGYLTVHPCGPPAPNASSLNYVGAVTGSNEIVADVDDDGRLCLLTSNSTHLVVDVTAYVAG